MKSQLHLEISRAALLEIKNVLDKICSENKKKPLYFALWRSGPLVGHGLPLSRLPDHTQTHRTRQDSSGRVIRPTQGPPPDNTQHSQQTFIRVRGGIQTRKPNKRAAADPPLRPRGHRHRLHLMLNKFFPTKKKYL